jgi:4-hydroxy-3-methylbut-2-enyl diphosphate reductase IspH
MIVSDRKGVVRGIGSGYRGSALFLGAGALFSFCGVGYVVHPLLQYYEYQLSDAVCPAVNKLQTTI